MLLLGTASFPREKVCGDGHAPRGVAQLIKLGIDTSEGAGWRHNKGIRIYGGKAFKLKEHVARLFDSARSILLEIPISQDEMCKAINDTIAINKKIDGYIRPLVTRGSGSLGLDPRKCSEPQVIVIVDDITMYPQEMYDNGMEIATVSTIRNHP